MKNKSEFFIQLPVKYVTQCEKHQNFKGVLNNVVSLHL